SRRRHTRLSRDWSSDVCSSDLLVCAHDWACHEARKEPDEERHLEGTADQLALATREVHCVRDHLEGVEADAEWQEQVDQRRLPEIGRASCREGAQSAVGAAARN